MTQDYNYKLFKYYYFESKIEPKNLKIEPKKLTVELSQKTKFSKLSKLELKSRK